MQYLWSTISLWSTEKWNYFDFNQLLNVIFRIQKNQYLTLVFLNTKEAL